MKTTTSVLGFAATAALVLAGLVPAQAAAQSESDVLYACFVPNSGTVYRVKGPELKDDCNSHRHVLFSWNRQGLAGEPGAMGATGPMGPTGEPGVPGATGPAGPQGATGDAGPIGPTGAKGDIGTTGPAGPEGPQGNAGPAGPIGPQGQDGVSGFQSVYRRVTCGTLQHCIFQVQCPVGKTVIAGGWYVANYKPAITLFGVFGSFPSNQTTWAYKFENYSAFENTEFDLRVSCVEI